MGTGNADCGSAYRGFRIAGASFGLLLAGIAWAQVPGEKSVHGMRVRVGVAPIEEIQALPAGRSERAMHVGHAANDREHLVVALADERTGKRIERAEVTATVSRLGMSEERHALEPMRQPGATSWGGFFDMRDPGPYVIRLEVSRPGDADPATTQFVYRNR